LRTILKLKKRLEKNKVQVKISHVYSHLQEKLKCKNKVKADEWSKKIGKQRIKYGELWEMVVKGNEEADKLAKQGTEKKARNIEGTLENVDEFGG